MTDTFDPNQPLELNIDLDELTIGEVALLEKTAGTSFGMIGAALKGAIPELPMGDILIGLALVSLRKKYPKITRADVEKIKISAITPDGPKDGGEGEALPPPTSPG